ncbi:MAG: glycosyltransferase, partial [Bacteroidales bacterium]|nr:glycosyltransferase [Bacteroidales bacterium]
MKKISVIILNWNGAQKGFLQQYLPSVIENTPTEWADVVVADNGSTDHSLELLKEQFPSVKVIALEHNFGYAEGNNRAVNAVETPYVLLLNDDVRVTPHWLEPMVDYLD